MKTSRSLLGKPPRIYLFLLVICVIFGVLYLVLKKPTTAKPSKHLFQQEPFLEPTPPAFDGEKLVHLDLKGAPPKISYYHKLFPLFKELGASGVVIEYEDMFPYEGPLKNISAKNCYSLEDVKVINELAALNGLSVVPLIQSFGHLEFVLKLEEFKDLREVPAYPQVLCPKHPEAATLLQEMISQMVEAHPNSKMLHIGADEVYFLGVCPRCTSAMSSENLSKNSLFLEHVKSTTKFIKNKFPQLRILIWDDEFRSITRRELRSQVLDFEPVVWKYTKDVYDELGPSLWENYAETFSKVWVASTFKGATGSNQIVSDVTHYVQNHRSWLSILSEHKTRIDFQGIIITGWQRYDHFAVLCELLPVGIPSLAMSLRLLQGHQDSPLSPPIEIAKILKCEQAYGLIGPAFGNPKCSFPGGIILEHVLHLQQLKQEFETILQDSRARGWLSNYNIKHVFSNPEHVETVTAPLNRIQIELNQLNYDLIQSMKEIYDDFTVEEWLETYVKPFEEKVAKLWSSKEEILSRDTWPRRPLQDEL